MKTLSNQAAASLNKILSFASEGLLRARGDTYCMYYDESRGRYCAIGCLLSPGMIKALQKHPKGLSLAVSSLYVEYSSLQRTLGFTLYEASIVQHLHDTWALGKMQKRQFVATIRGLLNGRITFYQANEYANLFHV